MTSRARGIPIDRMQESQGGAYEGSIVIPSLTPSRGFLCSAQCRASLPIAMDFTNTPNGVSVKGDGSISDASPGFFLV